MNLPAPLAMAISAGFNQYLALDEAAVPSLEPLYGRLIKVELSAINIGFFLLFHRDRVEVLEAFAGDADVVIRGAPFSMISLAMKHSDLASSGVEIEGDVELAERFNRIMQRVDIDWEEHLSRVTGDAIAHQLGNVARRLRGFVDRSQTRLQSNTADYLRDESTHLPHDWEVEAFCNEVDDLRDRVDALAARMTNR